MAFRGQYEYSLDAKNRLNVPAKFRAAFSSGIVLSKGVDPCVEIWTPEAFEGRTESVLARLNPVGSERRKLTRYLAGNSFDAELDAAGRVTLNQTLLSHGGIAKDVVVVGVLSNLEVWDRDAWLSTQERLSEEVPEIAEGLGHPS